jgi:hypothetical protein
VNEFARRPPWQRPVQAILCQHEAVPQGCAESPMGAPLCCAVEAVRRIGDRRRGHDRHRCGERGADSSRFGGPRPCAVRTDVSRRAPRPPVHEALRGLDHNSTRAEGHFCHARARGLRRTLHGSSSRGPLRAGTEEREAVPAGPVTACIGPPSPLHRRHDSLRQRHPVGRRKAPTRRRAWRAPRRIQRAEPPAVARREASGS